MTRRGISFLTTENLDGLLEGGNTVLAVWNKADCTKCATDFWDVRYLFYAFKDESDVLYWLVPQFQFFILGTTTGTDPELDQKYNVDTAYEGSVFRLFVKGSQSPYLPDEDFDLVTYFLPLSLRS